MAQASYQVICPNCQRLQRVASDPSSPTVSCPECAQAFDRPERIVLACPACSHQLKIKTEYLGRAAACKYCSQTFTLTSTLQVPPQAPAAPGRAAAEYQAEREQFVARLEQYERELEETRASLAHLGTITTERDVLATEKERLGRDLADALSRLGTLESERKEYLSEREARQAEVSELEGLRSRLAMIEPEFDSAREAIAGLTAEGDRLRESLSALEAATAESGQAREAVEELLAALESANSERDRLRDEVQDLQSSLEHLRTETDQLDRFKHELETIRAEKEELLARAAVPAPSASDAELARIAQEFDTAAGERDRLRQQSRSTREQMEQLWSENDRLQDLADDAERLKRERERILGELEAAKAAAAAGGDATAPGDQEQLRAQLEAAIKDRESARHQAGLLVQERQALQAQRDQAEMARKSSEERYQQVVQRGNDIFQKAKHQLDQLSLRNKSLSEEVQKLRSDLAQERQNGGPRRREPALADFGRQHVAMAGMTPPAPMERASSGPTVSIPLSGFSPQGQGAPAALANRSQGEIIEELRLDLERKLGKAAGHGPGADEPDGSPETPVKKERAIQATDLALNALAAFDDLDL